MNGPTPTQRLIEAAALNLQARVARGASSVRGALPKPLNAATRLMLSLGLLNALPSPQAMGLMADGSPPAPQWMGQHKNPTRNAERKVCKRIGRRQMVFQRKIDRLVARLNDVGSNGVTGA